MSRAARSRRPGGFAMVLACGALLLTGCAAVGTPGASAPRPSRTPLPYHGVSPTTPAVRPSFVLTDTSGRDYDFQARTAGRPTYLYFGYVNCPDECPTAMADVAAALRLAAPEDRVKAVVVFVTTDPARDSAPKLRTFLDQFNVDFVGLRGSQAQVDAAQKAARLPVAQPEGPLPTVSGNPAQHPHKPGTAKHMHSGPLGYGVGHANVMLAYDVADTLPVAYPGGVTPAEIAQDLPLLLG